MNKLNKFIKVHKDKTQREQNSNIIYKLSCNDCNASYVSQTRERERRDNCRLEWKNRNNIKLAPSKHSVIFKYIIETNHNFNWKNVNILDFEMNFRKRAISEMIHMKDQETG